MILIPHASTHTPASSAAKAALARTTRQAHTAIYKQLASLGPHSEGPRYLRPIVRISYSILLAAAPFLARTSSERLAPGLDFILTQPGLTASTDTGAQASVHAQVLTFVLAEAAVRLDLPAFIPALPLLHAALLVRAHQHLTHDPDATTALLATHTPALLHALRAGYAQAAKRHAGALRAFMLVEHPDFALDLHLPAQATAHADRHLDQH